MNPEQLDLRKLRTFQLVARHGSQSIAAARLNLSVPAVSLQIRRLEEELGISLFRRLPNKLVLTHDGEAFLEEVESIFQRVERALDTLSPKTATGGRLALAIGNDFAWYFAPRLGNFIRRFPGVEISLEIGRAAEVAEGVAHGALDVGLGVFTRLPDSVQKERVTATGLSIACVEGHPLLAARAPAVADIARHRLLVSPEHTYTRRQIDRTFAQAGVETRSYLEAGNCQTALNFASRGIGVALVHGICGAHEAADNLRLRDVSRQFGRVEIAAIYRRGTALSPALAGLLEELTAAHEN